MKIRTLTNAITLILLAGCVVAIAFLNTLKINIVEDKSSNYTDRSKQIIGPAISIAIVIINILIGIAIKFMA